MKVKSINLTGRALLVSTLMVFACGSTVSASGFTPYKVDMSRIEPNKPIRKSAILSKIRKKFPGRILSIREDRDGGPDCHVVKSMGNDGELRIIEVACKEDKQTSS